MSRRVPLVAALAGALVVEAIALIALREAPLARWGYVAAAVVFAASTVQAAPPVALASRLAHGAWGIPVRRLAELCGLSTLITVPVVVALLARLPDWHLRPSVWLDWPGAPLLWDTVAVMLLALAGCALALVPLRQARSLVQWRSRQLAATILGTLYLMCLVFVHVLLSSDLAMSLVPGWASPNFAAYQAVSSLQGGAAFVTLLLAVTNRHAERTFHALGKILLSLSLLWFYFTWSELLTYWYGRTPAEIALLSLLMFGPTLWLFVATALGAFVVPVTLLIWNPVRNSVRGPCVAAGLILLGLLLDRVRVYVAAWTVAGPVRERLEDVPVALLLPRLPELLAALAIVAAAVLLVALALPRPTVVVQRKRELAEAA